MTDYRFPGIAILLNGPPRAGKNLIAHLLTRHLRATIHHKFAKPLVDAMFLLHGVRVEHVDKDAPWRGTTVRRAMQCLSENYFKPTFGVDCFGHFAVDEIAKLPENLQGYPFVFSDSGFVNEARPLSQAIRCVQVIVRRPGRTFEGDTRSYWSHPSIPVIEFDNDVADVPSLSDKVVSDLIPELRSTAIWREWWRTLKSDEVDQQRTRAEAAEAVAERERLTHAPRGNANGEGGGA